VPCRLASRIDTVVQAMLLVGVILVAGNEALQARASISETGMNVT